MIKMKNSCRLRGFIRIHKGTMMISIISFIMGYIVCGNLKFRNEDMYFGDSHNYLGKNEPTDVFLIILIFSSLNNFARRDSIRNTWLSNINGNKEVVHVFAISAGSASDIQKSDLQHEQNKYNDLLIFSNLDDSFYLLTEKLLSSFVWLTDNKVYESEVIFAPKKTFRNFRYILKCDDDSFVRVPETVNELKTVFPGKKGEYLYWGFFDGRARPKKEGKYKEEQWKICDFYIPYALGGGYVLAQRLVHFMARNAKFLTKYRNEDISVGAWLATYSRINRVHEPKFDTEYISRGCHQSYLITHKQSESTMQILHENLKNTGRLCRKEFRVRMSYIYNWTVPPSRCCSRKNPEIP